MNARAKPSGQHMPATSPFDVLAEELGAVAGRIERSAALRIEAAVADIRRIDAERELRLVSLERRIEDRLATVKDGADGTSVTVADVEPLLREMVAALPPPKDGKDGVAGKDGDRGADGTSVTADDIAPMVRAEVGSILAGWERPQDGKSVTVEELAPLVEESVQRAVSAIPAPKDGAPGERGPEGPAGKLPVVKEWADGVFYEGEVVTRHGGVYQALRDTGKEPGHEDWRCIVERGRDGSDGRALTLRGTYSEDEAYRALDAVALNGASFAAKRDDPGACPGDGWQLLAMQGKAGKPGPKGDKGERGSVVTASVVGGEFTDNGVFIIKNADGSAVEIDAYPVLSKLGR